MRLLAVETTSEVAGAAVYEDGRIRAAESTDGTLMHAVTMMPMVERVLRTAGAEAADMDCFAVNIGPGSFTGIRIGVSSINALAFAAGKPVVAVDALTALCANVAGLCANVGCMLDAGNGRVYAALFDNSADLPAMLGELYLGDADAWLHALPNACLLLGEGALAQKERIAQLRPDARIAGAPFMRHSAAALAHTAAKYYAQGRTVRSAVPVYLARPQAERMLDGGL